MCSLGKFLFLYSSMVLLFYLMVVSVDAGSVSVTRECGENEEYTKCAVKCQPTCDNPNAFQGTCTRECLIGCICNKNYLRNAEGKCVKPEDCAKSNENISKA